MTRFFARLLLSIMVGVGAAATFDAGVKHSLARALDRSRAFVQDVAQTRSELAGSLDLSAEVDGRGEAEEEIGVEAQAQTAEVTHINRLLRRVSDMFAEADAKTALSAESETGIEVEAGAASLDLGNSLETDLELELGD